MSESPAAKVLLVNWSSTACACVRASADPITTRVTEREGVHLELLLVVPGASLDLGEPLSGLFALLFGCAEGIVGLSGCVRELFGDFDERSDVSECELVPGGGCERV